MSRLAPAQACFTLHTRCFQSCTCRGCVCLRKAARHPCTRPLARPQWPCLRALCSSGSLGPHNKARTKESGLVLTEDMSSSSLFPEYALSHRLACSHLTDPSLTYADPSPQTARASSQPYHTSWPRGPREAGCGEAQQTKKLAKRRPLSRKHLPTLREPPKIFPRTPLKLERDLSRAVVPRCSSFQIRVLTNHVLASPNSIIGPSSWLALQSVAP